MMKSRRIGAVSFALAAVCAVSLTQPPTSAEAFQPSTRSAVIRI